MIDDKEFKMNDMNDTSDVNEVIGSGAFIADPELYARLATPVESATIADQKSLEFYKRVCELREEYGVPEMVIAYSINHKNEDGEDVMKEYNGFRGGQFATRLIHGLLDKTVFGYTIRQLVAALAHEL